MKLTFHSRGVPLLSDQVRSGRLSVSDILAVHYGKDKLYSQVNKSITESMTKPVMDFQYGGLMAVGLAVQMYVKELKLSQGHTLACDIEIERDGITGHPDIIDFTDELIVEGKATTKRAPVGFKPGDNISILLYDSSLEEYFAQLACYMEMWGFKKGELNVCYLRGDYNGIDSFWDSYILEDAEEYTNGVWNLIKSYRDVLCGKCKKMYCSC